MVPMFSHGSHVGAGVAEEGAAGRRQRARASHCRRGGALERSGVGVLGSAERGDAQTFGPERCATANSPPTRRRSSSPRSRRSKRPLSSPSSRRPMPRVDVVHKTDGSAKFGIDAQVPGMVFAAITACPVPGGKLKSVDESVLAGAPGIVQVVKLDNAVAVVATDSYWRAKRALSRLQPEWDVGEAGKVDSDQLSQMYRAALNEPMLTARNDGNVDQAMSGAAKTFEAIYETPYLSHSPMEPMNATVNLQPDRLDVWVGTQARGRGTRSGGEGVRPEAGASLYPQRVRRRRLRPPRRER